MSKDTSILGGHCKEYLRPYLADLVSSVCKDDIELCAECVRKGSRFLNDPEGILNQILSEEQRSNGKPFSYSMKKELKTIIWEAQLKTVFPVIERYRGYFIRKYHDSIKKILPVSNSQGQNVLSAEEIEIGTLIYLVGNGTITLTNSCEYQELEMFREARNKLAHLNILDPKTVEMILKKAEVI